MKIRLLVLCLMLIAVSSMCFAMEEKEIIKKIEKQIVSLTLEDEYGDSRSFTGFYLKEDENGITAEFPCYDLAGLNDVTELDTIDEYAFDLQAKNAKVPKFSTVYSNSGSYIMGFDFPTIKAPDFARLASKKEKEGSDVLVVGYSPVKDSLIINHNKITEYNNEIFMHLKNPIDEFFMGAPVVNMDGEVLGIVVFSGENAQVSCICLEGYAKTLKPGEHDPNNTEWKLTKSSESQTNSKPKEKPLFDKPEKAEEPAKEFADKDVGDIIKFGKYQNESIEWKIIDKEDDRILLLSRQALDCMPFHTFTKAEKEACKNDFYNNAYVVWYNSSLRKWLNSSFVKLAFTDDERKHIEKTLVKNEDDCYADTGDMMVVYGGEDTVDMLFMLSIDEAKKYFDRYDARYCGVTPYAKKKGALFHGNEKTGRCPWWLRSPGWADSRAAMVWDDGTVYRDGLSGFDIEVPLGVRPAMWLRIR